MADRTRPAVVPPDRSPPVEPGGEPVVWFDMPDGLRVGLRPIHPDDREALMEGFASLSEDSRYHRFLTSRGFATRSIISRSPGFNERDSNRLRRPTNGHSSGACHST